MKKVVFVLFFVISISSILNGAQGVKIESLCSDSKELLIKFESNKLDLSEDALIDNTGGYVDIPAAKYYLKTKDRLYYIEGVVKKNKDDKKEFISNITQNMDNFITLKELYGLKDIKTMRFIQKIDLEKDNMNIASTNITTTNILDIYLDKTVFENEYKRCK